jgi:hypothetical protein
LDKRRQIGNGHVRARTLTQTTLWRNQPDLQSRTGNGADVAAVHYWLAWSLENASGLVYQILPNAEIDLGCNFGVTDAAADFRHSPASASASSFRARLK